MIGIRDDAEVAQVPQVRLVAQERSLDLQGINSLMLHIPEIALLPQLRTHVSAVRSEYAVDLKPRAPLLTYAFPVIQRLHITHLTVSLMIEHTYQWVTPQ